MATNNSVNTPLSGTTGTGNFVGSTSPALTTPKIGQINDINGVAIIELAAASAPVNYFKIYNGNTLIAPQLRSIGSDTNINLDLVSKGTGQIRISSEATVSQFQINTGPSYQHLNALTFPNTAATTSYIFPDTSGTVALSGASQNVSFGTVQTSQINDTNGNASLAISATASAVNYLTIQNTSTGTPPNIIATGSDTNLQLSFQAKGNGGFKFACAAPTTVFQIYAGTGTQHLSQINFPDTAGTTTYTFPDATGTVALSGASQNVQFGQVGANGPNISTYALTARGGTNQNLAISGATLIANAVTLAAVNDANSANVPLEIRASGIYASTGMVNSTAGNIVKWNPTGGQFTYDSQPLSVSLGGTGSSTNSWTANSLTFTSTTGIVGTTTNDNAATGSVGEFVSSSVSSGSPVSLTSGVTSNLTSISLTAGDWDVYYNAIYFPANTTTLTRVYSGLNSTSATQPGINDASTTIQTVGITGDGANIFYNTNGSIRVSLNATTTYYAVVQGTFAVSTCTAFGWLWARRRR